MSETREIHVPDIGGEDDVEIIEVLISPGDSIAAEDSLITLESDKASMEVPAPFGGKVQEIKVSLGDKVSQGDIICTVEAADEAEDGETEAGSDGDEAPSADASADSSESKDKDADDDTDDKGEEKSAKKRDPRPEPLPVEDNPDLSETTGPRESPTAHIDAERQRKAHASPSVRRFARDLGVDLGQVEGSGRKGRILRDDVTAFVKRTMQAGGGTGGALGVAPMPEIDFSEFGEVETQPLTKINRLTGRNLHRNWVNIPHVTQFDEADITELERFRKQLNEEKAGDGVKFTMVAFLLQAAASALREFPRFNSSLDSGGENLVLKHYVHIGVAVDTPNGLVVPVIRDVDRKRLTDIAGELMEISEAARNKKLTADQMKGGCFSISSLGGVGGTAFTPIVNAPEVAILGVSRAQMKPVHNATTGEFDARLMLPLSLSYDHRVIDGASAARFTNHLGKLLTDMRRVLV